MKVSKKFNNCIITVIKLICTIINIDYINQHLVTLVSLNFCIIIRTEKCLLCQRSTCASKLWENLFLILKDSAKKLINE